MNYMQKDIIFYYIIAIIYYCYLLLFINKSELDIQKIRVEYWYQNVLNPDPVNLCLKIKHNAEFLLPKVCKSSESPNGATNHFLLFFLSLALTLVFHSRNKNFTAGMYITLMMLWFRNATNRC